MGLVCGRKGVLFDKAYILFPLKTTNSISFVVHHFIRITFVIRVDVHIIMRVLWPFVFSTLYFINVCFKHPYQV